MLENVSTMQLFELQAQSALELAIISLMSEICLALM